MATQAIKHTFRVVLRHGLLAPLEPLDLPDGTTAQVTLEVLPTKNGKRRPDFERWNLGVKEPLTRDEIYGDLI